MAKKDNTQIIQKLKQLARDWPRPGELIYFIDTDHIWLHKVRLPLSSRGEGTKRMAQFLSLTDKLNLPVCLTADPVSVDEDSPLFLKQPDTYHLVKWYKRFDFTPLGPSEDGFLMQREPLASSSFDLIMKKYNENKKNNDLSSQEFYAKWPPSPERKLGL